MMRKTLTLLALSQLALAGALYASDGSWFDEPQLSAKTMHTVVPKPDQYGGMATSIGMPGTLEELGTDRLCDKAYWPYIPAECLRGEMAEAADEVRTISIN